MRINLFTKSNKVFSSDSNQELICNSEDIFWKKIINILSSCYVTLTDKEVEFLCCVILSKDIENQLDIGKRQLFKLKQSLENKGFLIRKRGVLLLTPSLEILKNSISKNYNSLNKIELTLAFKLND
jgi:hypothetical protein